MLEGLAIRQCSVWVSDVLGTHGRTTMASWRDVHTVEKKVASSRPKSQGHPTWGGSASAPKVSCDVHAYPHRETKQTYETEHDTHPMRDEAAPLAPPT